MANLNAPRGLKPYQMEGKTVRSRNYAKTASEEIFKGDLLMRVPAGTVEQYVAGTALAAGVIVGVAMHYSAAANTDPVAVMDDPEATYIAETTGTFDLVDIGLNADIGAAPAGDADLGRSAMVVDMATKAATVTLPLKIFGLAPAVNGEDNAAGAANADILVKINQTERAVGQVGI